MQAKNESRPFWLTVIVCAVCVAVPCAGPVATLFGFLPLPWHLLLVVAGIVGGYLVATEAAKAWFYRGTRTGRRGAHV